MSLAFKKIKTYSRLALVVAIVAAVGLILLKNRGNTVGFWLFGLIDENQPRNVLWIILCTMVATLAVRWVTRLTGGLWEDMREFKRLRALKYDDQVTRERAADLDDRERRLDTKVQQAISANDEVGDKP